MLQVVKKLLSLGSLLAPPLSRFRRGSGISIYFSMADLWVDDAATAEGILGGRHTEVGRARSNLNRATHTEVRSSKFAKTYYF